MFKTLIVILMTSVLVNNYVLNRFLGICPFLGVSKKLNQAVGMGCGHLCYVTCNTCYLADSKILA